MPRSRKFRETGALTDSLFCRTDYMGGCGAAGLGTIPGGHAATGPAGAGAGLLEGGFPVRGGLPAFGVGFGLELGLLEFAVGAVPAFPLFACSFAVSPLAELPFDGTQVTALGLFGCAGWAALGAGTGAVPF